MIQLTRINRTSLVLNADLIEFIEGTPDTVISLVTGQKIRVLETADQVVKKVVNYRKQICESRPPCASSFQAAILASTPDEDTNGKPGRDTEKS